MPREKPTEMSDEMWAAVCIVMDDQGVKNYRELLESNEKLHTRLDEIETKWSEREAEGEAGSPEGPEGGEPGGGGAAGQGAGGTGTQGTSGAGPQGGTTPPPVVQKGEAGSGEGGEQGEGKKGSGRGGRLRWYERREG